MAGINILEITPTQLCSDLRGRYVLLYGLEKSGKTSMSVMWPKPLLCAFEKGYNALIGVKAVDIDKWATFKQICKQLKTDAAKEMYETIIIDTYAIAASMAEKYICSREGVDKLADILWGQGWNMLKDEIETTLRELTQLGYAIVLLAHSKERKTEMVDDEGNAIYAQMPDLTNTVRQIANRMVDIIGYIGIEFDKDGNSHRYLYTRSTPTIFAGSRYAKLAPKIKLSYDNLVDAVAEAMRLQAEETGTSLVNEEEYKQSRSTAVAQERDFAEVMEDAKNFWLNYLSTAENDEDKERKLDQLNGIVYKVFGKQIKLSSVTPAQKDLVELVLTEFNSL